jgi:hypothetical protein
MYHCAIITSHISICETNLSPFILPGVDSVLKVHWWVTYSSFPCWKQAKAGKKGNFGKEGMHEESDSWKEEKHTHMHGRPNDIRVRVLQYIVMARRARNV